MKINELIIKNTYKTNEEKQLLASIDEPRPLGAFPEREQTIINNLIRKSIITKVQHNGTIMVIRNDNEEIVLGSSMSLYVRVLKAT